MACAVGLGVVLGGALTPQDARLLLVLGLGLLVLAWAAARPAFGAGAVAAAALALGAASTCIERTEYRTNRLGGWVDSLEAREPVRVRGRAASDAWEVNGDWILLLDVVEAERRGRPEAVTGRVRVRVGGVASRPEVIAGDVVSVWTTLARPRGFGDSAADDAEARAFRGGIHATGYCKSALVVSVERPPFVARSLSGRIGLARAWARSRLVGFIPGGPELDVTRAMVLGDKTGLDDATAEAFRIAGTYHVLAISGAQVALVGALLLVPLRWAGVPRWARAVAVSAALGGYALFVGGDVPVVRAALMASVLLTGRALDLDSDGANLLGLAGLMLLVWRPSSIGDAGFQLSFAATLGLLVLARPVRGLLCLPRLPLGIDLALAVSVAAQLALLPLLLQVFHRVAVAALVLNLVAVPLSTLVLLAGCGVIVASSVSTALASAVGHLAWYCARALVLSGSVVRWAPALDVRLPTPSPAAVVVYLIGLALVASGRRPRAALGMTAIGLLGLLTGSAVPLGDGTLRLDVVDVGQGDCLVLHSPGGKVLVVDTGGAFDRPLEFGESVVGPHLWADGVRSIDRLILTHAHPDHVGAVPFLLRSFRVGDVWEGPAPSDDPIYARLDEGLRDARVPRRTVLGGLSAAWEGVRLDVLWPGPPRPRRRRTRNDDSVVVRVAMGRVAFLLTGDLEASGEAHVAGAAADVLKVPHHGSRTSSTPDFIRRVGPRVAVVSVGFHSSFGHPHAEVLERYARAGALLFRTDLDGTVRFATDGRRLWVATARTGLTERLR